MAKRNVPLFVSAVGWIASLVEKLINVLREKGITDEEIHSLVTKDGDVLIGAIADAIVEFLKKTKKIIYSIFVDYTKSIEELVKLGKYDWANGDITTKNFPTKRSGKMKTEINLIHFDRSISSEEVLKELDKMGYRAAELYELLTFGARYPDVQREFPVVALGSVWQSPSASRCVAYLRRRDSKRYLLLYDFGRGWSAYCRFAAVRK